MGAPSPTPSFLTPSCAQVTQELSRLTTVGGAACDRSNPNPTLTLTLTLSLVSQEYLTLTLTLTLTLELECSTL